MTRPDEIRDVLEKVATLAPAEADAPRPASRALADLKRRIGAETPSWSERIYWRLQEMLTRKHAFVTLFLIVFLGVALTFPPVRAAASEFLGLFRVEKFAAVSVSPEQVALLEQIAEEGLYPGQLEMMQEPGGAQPVDSLAEAEAETGRHVSAAAAMPAPDEIYVTGGGAGRLTVDLESARSLMEAAGVDPLLLPDTLDGATVDVEIFPMVEQRWSDGTMFVQSQSPVVDYPDNVDATALGKALLLVLGMSPEEAERLANDIQWESTVLLPIPQDVATFREVSVNGSSGLALSSLDGQHNAIMWQQSGVVYLLAGEGNESGLVDIATSIE